MCSPLCLVCPSCFTCVRKGPDQKQTSLPRVLQQARKWGETLPNSTMAFCADAQMRKQDLQLVAFNEHTSDSLLRMKKTCYGSILCRPSRRRCSLFALLTHQTDIPGLPLWFFSKLGCKGPCSQQKLQMLFSGDIKGSWSFQCLPETPVTPFGLLSAFPNS
jgi:hypothetical protein